MDMWEKYWMSIWMAFLRYLSIIMLASGIAWIFLGHFLHPWWYVGLASWPLLIMWGVVNLKYIRCYAKIYRIE